MSLVYAQKTGDLYADGQWVSRGYSGHGVCKNQPDSQNIPEMGPIPCGEWMIMGPPEDTQEHGPFVLKLIPDGNTQTFGRMGFLIHGDAKVFHGSASRGCIVLPRDVREFIWGSGIRLLVVVPDVRDMNATPPDGIRVPPIEEPPQEGEV